MKNNNNNNNTIASLLTGNGNDIIVLKNGTYLYINKNILDNFIEGWLSWVGMVRWDDLSPDLDDYINHLINNKGYAEVARYTEQSDTMEIIDADLLNNRLKFYERHPRLTLSPIQMNF